MVDTLSEENRKKWVDGQEVENNSDKLFIQYDVGSIWQKGKLKKGLAGLKSMIPGLGGTRGQTEAGSISGRHPSVSGVWHSEFQTEDDRGGDVYNYMNQVGSYLYPYFYGYGDRDQKDEAGNILYTTQSKKKFEVDTHNLPAHYLYTHCYYNFRIYGEDFAKVYGVEKMSGSNIYGFEWGATLTHNVGWHMTAWIFYGQSFEYLNFDCMLKEDLNPSDGALAKWIAMAVGTLALSAGGAAISGMINCAGVSLEGAANTAAAGSINRAADTLTFRDWTGNPKDRDVPMNSSAAVKAKNDMREEFFKFVEKENNAEAWGAMKKQVSGAIGKSVGHAFSTLPRTFFGGRGSYSGSIDEFLENKAHWPLLYVEARTSQRYQDLWTIEMNRRIAQWDFWFGNDPEIALRKDFGACVGKGYSEEKDEGVLKDLYGWIQLGENTIFNAKLNPFIEEWIEQDKFVYQLRESKRPKLTTKDFFEGSKGELTFGFERAGSHTELDYTRKEEVITTHRYPCSNAVVYGYFWVETGTPTTGERHNKYIVSNEGGKTGEGNKFVKYDGGSNSTPLNWSDYHTLKGKPYQMIYFASVNNGERFEFGKESKYLITRYLGWTSGEEELYESPDPQHTTWVLTKTDGGRFGGSNVEVTCEVKGIKVLSRKVELDFNSLNIQCTVPIQGFSGIEGWGNNPPDSFGGSSGGGGLPITNPAWAQVLSSGGMMLPDTNTLNTNQLQMPTQIQSMVNTEQVFTPLELPQLSPLQSMMNMNQEYLQNNISQQENIHQSLHDNVQQKQKEEVKE